MYMFAYPFTNLPVLPFTHLPVLPFTHLPVYSIAHFRKLNTIIIYTVYTHIYAKTLDVRRKKGKPRPI